MEAHRCLLKRVWGGRGGGGLRALHTMASKLRAGAANL